MTMAPLNICGSQALNIQVFSCEMKVRKNIVVGEDWKVRIKFALLVSVFEHFFPVLVTWTEQ